MAAGVASLLIVARALSPQAQGYFFTFTSLSALVVFFELSLGLVIVNVASHEWASLRLAESGQIEGDTRARERLRSLGRRVFVWYAAAGLLYFCVTAPVGQAFLSRTSDPIADWIGPWFTLAALSGGLLLTMPAHALLEGCNQVAAVNRYRLVQSIVASLALWTTLLLGGGLWSLATQAAARLGCDLVFLLGVYGRFFSFFRGRPQGPVIGWREEVWPMQWRVGLSGVVNYFAYQLFNPVMFRYHGAAVAGRMGMTWSIVNVLQGLGLAWIQPRVPEMGGLIARHEFDELDRRWYRICRVSLGIVATCGSIVLVIVYLLQVEGSRLGSRMLPIWPSALFVASTLGVQMSQLQSAYLRAHKQEPIVVMSVSQSLAIGLLVWQLGERMGPVGAALAYILATSAGLVWETHIWRRCRALWHSPDPAGSPTPHAG